LPPAQSSRGVDELRRHLRARPGDGRGWLVLAQILFPMGASDELRTAVGKAVGLLPDNYQAWLLAARSLAREQGEDAAAAWLRRSARDRPELPAPRLASAALLGASQPAEAIGICEQLAGRFPADARPHVLMADLHRRQGAFRDAVRCLERASTLEPDNAGYRVSLGSALLASGSPEGAVAAANQALEIDQRLPGALLLRAEALRADGRWQQALEDFQAAARLQGAGAPLLNSIGACLMRLEQPQAALAHFQQALRQDSGYAPAKLNLGLYHVTRLEAEEAARWIEEALRDPSVDAATRQRARTALAILAEQTRLRPHVEEAVRTGDVSGLRSAVESVPPELGKVDPSMLEELHRLADSCTRFPFRPEEPAPLPDTDLLPFVEACGQAKCEGDAHVLAELHRRIAESPPGATADGGQGKTRAIWQANRDRRQHAIADLYGEAGEAWLRYWHARLLGSEPQALPGQFKAIENAVGLGGKREPTAPESVVGTVRELLSNLAPTVPAGLARGVFLYVALCTVHGFADGNGRLARFLLGWELECSGLGAIAFPRDVHARLLEAVYRAQADQTLEPLNRVLADARQRTGELVRVLGETLRPG